MLQCICIEILECRLSSVLLVTAQEISEFVARWIPILRFILIEIKQRDGFLDTSNVK